MERKIFLPFLILPIVIFLLAVSGVGAYYFYYQDVNDDPEIFVDDFTGPQIQVALLLDTSNSMDGLIHQAKAQLWDIVNVIDLITYQGEEPRLQIALYEYGNDNLDRRGGYIRQVSAFSSDLDLLSEKLFSLTTNGGSEYCGQVISDSVERLTWSNDDNNLKFIFIAGNEPFTQGDMNYHDAIGLAKEKDIIVNTIHCGDYEVGVRGEWKNAADISGGKYLNIDHNQELVYIETPYDEQILQLNQSLNETYLYYGESGSNYKERQVEQDENASSINPLNLVKRAVTKSSSKYKNEQWDLVDASQNEDFDLSSIKEEQLPEELQGLSDDEKKVYIEEQQQARLDLQEQINDLEVQRQEYLQQQQAVETDDNTLNDAIVKMIKDFATAKNYDYQE